MGPSGSPTDPAQLDPDLVQLLDDRCLRPVETSSISTIMTGKRARATLRVDCGAGGIFKARVFGESETPSRLASLEMLLEADRFSPIVDTRGTVVLEQWIDGSTVECSNPSTGMLRECGAILGRVHEAAASPGREEQRLSSDAHMTALEAAGELLQNSGVLDEQSLDQALAVARIHAPSEVSIGVTHNDMCPQNIVMTRDGRLYVIDNELLSLDAHDSDLGRTWYRWPMTGRQLQAFISGYQSHRSFSEFAASFPFWSIYTLVNATAFHVAIESVRAREPADRLRRLLESMDREWNIVKLAFRGSL